MVKRIGLIPLFPFCFFLAFIAGTGRGEPTNSSTDIGQAKTHIMSLIESGDYTKAKEAVDKLADDFPDEPQLAQTLHAFTEKYEYARRFEEAKHVYQKIIQKFPNSSYANRARLGVIREDVMFFIASQNYDGAKQTLDKMVANFAGHKDLPDTLYWIAERYEWEYRFEDANRIYQQVIQRYPDSSWAAKAKLGISRAQVMSLINSQNYDLAGEALNKLSTDFTGNQDLPQTLYW
jgi:TolA-binding protein